MAKYRDISPLECSYLASDSKTQSYFVNQFIIEGKGSIQFSELQSAVKLAADANPGINVKLKGYWGKRYWSDEGFYPHVESYHSDWHGITQEGAKFSSKLIDCRKKPCAEVILLESTRPKIIFRTHHAVCDGAGTLHWIEEVFRALRHEALLGSNGRLCEWNIAQNYSVAKYNLAFHPWTPVKNQNNSDAIFEFNWQHFFIPGDVSKLVPKVIKTLADIAWEYKPKGYVCFRIPSDLRRLIDDHEIHIGNLTGSIDIEVKATQSIEDIAKIIINEKRKNKDLAVFPKNLWLAKWLPKFLFSPSANYYKKKYQAGHCNLTGIISHINKVKLENLSYKDFHATGMFGIPIPLEGVSASCGLIQNDTGIHGCITMPKSLASEKELAHITSLLINALSTEQSQFIREEKKLYLLKG